MSLKEDLAYLLQVLNDQDCIVINPELRIIMLDTLSAYENLYYELEKWKSNYQTLEKELFVRGQRCTKYHVTDRPRKEQYIRMVCEYKCGICSEKMLYDKFLDKYNSDKFLCDICLKTHHVASGVYHCKHCKFDVCNNCPDFLNVQQHRICQKCSSQIYHVHSLSDPISGKYTCFKCENEFHDVDGVFACGNCDFLMCPSCEKDLRKMTLFNQLKFNSQHATPEKQRNIFDFPSSQKESPTKLLVDKVKKGGLQLSNLDAKISENEPPRFKEQDFMTFSGKRNENKTDKSLEEFALKPKVEEPATGSQPMRSEEKMSYDILPLKNDSFSIKNDTSHFQPTGDFHLKSEQDLSPITNPTENQYAPIKMTAEPLNFHEPLPWKREDEGKYDGKYAEMFRNV